MMWSTYCSIVANLNAKLPEVVDKKTGLERPMSRRERKRARPNYRQIELQSLLMEK